MRILLTGMIAGVPGQGGAAWAVLQYLLGLRELGHQVTFIEPVSIESTSPEGTLRDSHAARYLDLVRAEVDTGGDLTLLRQGTEETYGLPYATLLESAREADLLLNISGMLRDERLLEASRRRVWLDLDPVFNQLWCAADGIDLGFDRHTHHVTVGLAIGSERSAIPTCGHRWITTLQPVVLSRWPRGTQIETDAFTTIANWRGYGSINYKGTLYGQKVHSLRPLIDLPSRTETPMLLALAIDEGESSDLAALRENGWRLIDQATVASTPAAYQRFIQGSRAELGITKSGYVEGRSGWFSDRSLCYLASGRPVLAQETGYSEYIPSGVGIVPFSTVEEAAAGADTIMAEYRRHSDAAREIAEECFASERVLPRLLERIGEMGG